MTKEKCECGQEITQEGEFRCYDCWSEEMDQAFPKGMTDGERAGLFALVCIVIWLVVVALVEVFR